VGLMVPEVVTLLGSGTRGLGARVVSSKGKVARDPAGHMKAAPLWLGSKHEASNVRLCKEAHACNTVVLHCTALQFLHARLYTTATLPTVVRCGCIHEHVESTRKQTRRY
jgi:hypothetical protein